MKRESTITASQRPFRKLSWLMRIHAVTTWWGKLFKQNGQAHYSTDAFSSVHSPTYTHKLGQDGRKKILHTSKRKWCISIYLNKPTLILQANCQAHYSTDAFSSVHIPIYTHKLGQDARNEIKKPFVKGDGMFK
jgi:hypothetical protein